jgi:hypothetical protein
MATPADHDAYVAAAPEQFRASLRRLRSLLSHALPDDLVERLAQASRREAGAR